jgi:hypothetical protein
MIDECFYRMRPSDRDKLAIMVASPDLRNLVTDAVIRYVSRWEDAAWVEDYSIARIGKWFARSAPPELTERLKLWADLNQTVARKALLEGLEDGLALHPAKSQRSDASVPLSI